MSKFLKFLVAVILTAFILGGLALVIPSFISIETTVVQENMTGNQPVGTVIYTKSLPVAKLMKGDRVVEMQTGTLNVYRAASYNADQEMLSYEEGGESNIADNKKVMKVLWIIPYLGFLSIATQSFEGMMILALILIIVIVLFIIAEMVRKRDDDETEEKESDDDFFSELAERKAASDQAAEKKAGKKKKSKKKEEEDDGFFRPFDFENPGQPEEVAAENSSFASDGPADRQADAEDDEAAQLLKQIVLFEEDERPKTEMGEWVESAPVSEEAEDLSRTKVIPSDVSPGEDEEAGKAYMAAEPALRSESGTLPDVQAALEAALENQQLNRQEAPSQQAGKEDTEESGAEGEGSEELELAMPIFTSDEILAKAYADGLDPKVREDGLTGVTLVDYSDCI